MGGKLNAFTTKEYMCLYSRVLSCDSQKLIEILYNLLAFPSFQEKDIEIEKQIIINEIFQYNNNQYERCQANLISSSWNGHPLSKEIMGDINIIREFHKERLVSFYENALNAYHIVISISGNISSDLLNTIEKNFSSFKGKAVKHSTQHIQFLTTKKIDSAKLTQHYVSIGLPAYSYSNPRLFALLILNNILGSGSVSLLTKSLREEKGLVYSIGSYPLLYSDGGVLITNASSPYTNSIDKIVEAITNIFLHLKKRGITNEELRRGKAIMKGNIAFGLENIGTRMIDCGKNEILDINEQFFMNFQHIDDIYQQIEK